MAYRAPPGTSSSSNSLPARPPAPAGGSGFKPAFGTVGANGGGVNAYSNATQYGPSSHYSAQTQYGASASGRYAPSTGQYGSSSSYSSYPGAPGTGVSSGSQGGYSSYPGHTQQQAPSYGTQAPAYGASYAAATQIQNPFPAPGTGFDVSEAAQIAEWQSAYGAAPQLGKDGKPVATNATDSPRPDAAAAAAAANTNPDKKKTVVRSGGGKTWTDDSLLEWDPNHMRIFVGNLAGETTDESLLKAFSRWKSVQKARVIRDKRSTKSKGYGFVSFADADDFFQAAKEMNGKYIQSHPVVVKKANTDIKATSARDRGKGGYHNNKGGKNNKNKSGNQSGGGGGGYEPSLGPVPGAGVTKPGQKTKNGLRLLG